MSSSDVQTPPPPSSFEVELFDLVRHDLWENVLRLRAQYPIDVYSRYLWAWPTDDSLEIMRQILVRHRCQTVLSIGCGSGLLEWIFHKKTGIPVTGLELDKSWWTSPYSPAAFVPLNFVNAKRAITTDFLRHCARGQEEDNKNDDVPYALLFCYFNDKEAFNEYVRHYDGRLIIIIGPEGCSGTVTDPQPLRPQFEYSAEYRWSIETIVNIDNFNYVAAYRKCFK